MMNKRMCNIRKEAES